MIAERIGLSLCLVAAAACSEVRLADSAAGGAGGATGGEPPATSVATSVSTTVGSSTSSSTSVTTGGGISVEVLPTDTSANLRAVTWRGDTIVVAGDAATALELHPGAAPTKLTAGLEAQPLLRFTSLTTLAGVVYAGAIDGEGDQLFAHVVRFDGAWAPAWIPQTTCLREPMVATFRESQVVAVCGYYPFVGLVDGGGLSLEAIDGFDRIAYLSYPKWDELLASDGSSAYTLDGTTLERTSSWTLPPNVNVTALLGDHRGQRIGLDDAGDVILFGKGAAVQHPGDGRAFRAGAILDVDATILVGDDGNVALMRGLLPPEQVDVGVDASFRAVAVNEGRAVVVGDGGVALLVTIQ